MNDKLYKTTVKHIRQYLLHKKLVEAYLYFPGKLLSILSVKLSTNIGESDFPLHNLLSTTR